MQSMQDLLKDIETRMNGSLDTLGRELASVRTGRAAPVLLDTVRADYYGTPTPVGQTASVSVLDARTLVIQRLNQSQPKAIEKAIMTSDLELTPVHEAKVVRLTLPTPTAE